MASCARIAIVILILLIICVSVIWFVPLHHSKKSNSLLVPFHNTFWDREERMDPHGRILVKWNFTDEEITMMVIGAATGFITLGFSLNPRLEEADIIIGWIKNNDVHLKDLHIVHNSEPILDSKQDVELLFGKENATHTVLCFKRKLNTCDKQDFVITNSSVYVFWSFHNKDPDDVSNLSIPHYGRDRGFLPLRLLDVDYPAPPLENMEYIDIGANGSKIPYSVAGNYYLCRIYKIPNFDGKRHFIGYIPMIQPENANLVHHILLYKCIGNDLDKVYGNVIGVDYHCYEGITAENDLFCRRQLVSWTIGSKGEFFPPHVGYPFGSSRDEPYYILMQIHYSFPKRILDFQDSTKIRLYYSKDVRPNEFSTLNVMNQANSLYIPKEQVDFSVITICSSFCTKDFPADGIRAFRYTLHAHTAARKIRIHHFRNGVEINTIVEDNFQFNYQQARSFKTEMVILPNDWLAVECVYDSRNRTTTLVNGLDSSKEMCLVILQYYPPVELSLCASSIESTSLQKSTGYFAVNNKELARLYLQHFRLAAILEDSNNLSTRFTPLTNQQVKALRKLYLEGNHTCLCINDTDFYINESHDVASFSQGRLRTEEDQCREKF